MKLLKGRCFNPGDKKPVNAENLLPDVGFNIHKFNNRPRPPARNGVLIVTCFSEFGCESIGAMYCLPRLLQMYSGAYVVVVGWHGRQYLYKHLVDEYWELKEEHQWLREYCRAFHFESKNLTRLHEKLKEHGIVISSTVMGRFALGNNCRDCRHFWQDISYVTSCPECKSVSIERSLFGDVPTWRKTAVRIPSPCKEKQNKARKYIPDKPAVGIFARGRRCYGRNLQPDFYVKLIHQLRQTGYEPVWLGEKQSTLPCPVDDVLDFSRMPESRDLELTLAIINQLEFTIQFWTASTRLAAMADVPFILFESPDQIAGHGQEGYRMALTSDWDKKKLVLSHYLDVYNNHDKALEFVQRAIDEMNSDNWNHIIGLVENPDFVKNMIKGKNLWSENNAGQ